MSTPSAPSCIKPLCRVCLAASFAVAAGLIVMATVSLSPRVLGQEREAELAAGEKVYQQHCAACHGESGEGVEEEFSSPLTGDKSVPDLTRYIERKMPEDDPEAVVGDDAERVARYIYDAFYSPAAQVRNQGIRIELSRLTVRQYRNAVADLVGGFRSDGPMNPGEERGLPGRYYNKEKPRGGDAVLERRDPSIQFEFGEATPIPDEVEATKGFSARWEGSVIAPETGEYEITLHTDHGARLWLNDMDEPLIDAWVQSGDQTEHRGSIYLIDGRAYPLRLWFSSRQQGVDDQKKHDGEPIEGFIKLHWKRPERVAEPIPSRLLVPERAPETFAIDTPFPPDDSSSGYARGTSVSKAWADATTKGAIETARYVIAHLRELAGVREKGEGEAQEREAKLREFSRRFVERAFRRPLTDEQRELYVERQFEEASDPEEAVKRVVLLALKSPRFLYLDFDAEDPDGYDIATRLSFALWDSLPDEQLLKAAAEGRLASRRQVARQALRMVDDPRARSKTRRFMHHWLRLDHAGELVKNSEAFPDFDERLAADLRTSLDLFIEDVIWGEEGSNFRKLMGSNKLYLNGRLAQFYGYDLPADAPFQEVSAKRLDRAGVVSHPLMMASFAYTKTSSPIHRGVFLIRNVLGRTLRPPPEAFTPDPPDLHPNLTTRQRVAKQTEAESCQKCHAKINPIGFALEHFDAAGRFRTMERDQPINAIGRFELPSGEVRRFDGARDLAEFLADSELTHRAFAAQLFQHMVKQPVLAYHPEMPEHLRRAFAAHGFNIRRLMAEIATTAAVEGVERIAGASPPHLPVIAEAESTAMRSRAD